MRRVAIVCLSMSVLASVAFAADIKTGADLMTSCRDYVATSTPENARAPHDCRTFLQGFAVALKAREDARIDAMVRGLPFSSKEACVRMPDYISFRDLAVRIVNFTQANPAMLTEPATVVAQRTLERDFPCPTNERPR